MSGSHAHHPDTVPLRGVRLRNKNYTMLAFLLVALLLTIFHSGVYFFSLLFTDRSNDFLLLTMTDWLINFYILAQATALTYSWTRGKYIAEASHGTHAALQKKMILDHGFSPKTAKLWDVAEAAVSRENLNALRTNAIFLIGGILPLFLFCSVLAFAKYREIGRFSDGLPHAWNLYKQYGAMMFADKTTFVVVSFCFATGIVAIVWVLRAVWGILAPAAAH